MPEQPVWRADRRRSRLCEGAKCAAQHRTYGLGMAEPSQVMREESKVLIYMTFPDEICPGLQAKRLKRPGENKGQWIAG